MKNVFVFPGQGSQSMGMLAQLAATDRVITDTFTEASEALGYDLWKLVQEGPAEQLNETVRTQPMMLVAGMATWRYWKRIGGPDPDVVCGHSLGEYTALAAAQALQFPDVVKLVRRRAELMQQAVPVGEGAIAAVLGLDDAAIAAACSEAAQGEAVDLVNFNSPGQVVIAGNATAVDRALEGCKARGAKRAVLLPMSVPAHSSLMRPAADRFADDLKNTGLQKPRIAFWSPVDCAAHDQPDDIQSLLHRQLASPVLWCDLVRTLAAAGANTFIECGPGKVLTGLGRRIDKQLHCLALQDPDSVQAVLASLQTEAGETA
ncbi:MAG: ACP S-malonyltransferase [Pseudomonadota bacterium]